MTLEKLNHPRPRYLPVRVWQALIQLAHQYHDLGVDLFIFGSFARGDARPNSDLDLGVEWRGRPQPALFTRLYGELRNLPTIRKIDLVDFSQAAASFTQVAAVDKIYLTDTGLLPDETNSPDP